MQLLHAGRVESQRILRERLTEIFHQKNVNQNDKGKKKKYSPLTARNHNH